MSDSSSQLPYRNPEQRLKWALLIIVVLLAGGTAGYVVIEKFTVLEALYMTVITLSTVGFGEVHTLSPAGRVFTTFIILAGVGTLAYGVSQIAELLIDSKVFLQKRREAAIARMENHVIVCGFGRIGRKVAERLREHRTDFVIVENSGEQIAQIEKLSHKYIIGDAREDATLLKSSIRSAKTLVSALRSDADNLFVVLTARNLNPDLYIVARASQMVTYDKLMQAGANKVISPYEIGANYIASAVVRPNVLDFMDVVSETAMESEKNLEIEEIYIPEGSSIAGLLLRDTDLRTARNIIVLAMKKASGEVVYNPASSERLEAGGTIICIGYTEELDKFSEEIAK